MTPDAGPNMCTICGRHWLRHNEVRQETMPPPAFPLAVTHRDRDPAGRDPLRGPAVPAYAPSARPACDGYRCRRRVGGVSNTPPAGVLSNSSLNADFLHFPKAL